MNSYNNQLNTSGIIRCISSKSVNYNTGHIQGIIPPNKGYTNKRNITVLGLGTNTINSNNKNI